MAFSNRPKASKLWYKIPFLGIPGPRFDINLGINNPGVRILQNDERIVLLNFDKTLGLPTEEINGGSTPYADTVNRNEINEIRTVCNNLITDVFAPSGVSKCDWVYYAGQFGSAPTTIIPYKVQDFTAVPATSLDIISPAGSGSLAALEFNRSDIVSVSISSSQQRYGMYAYTGLPSSFFKTFKGCTPITFGALLGDTSVLTALQAINYDKEYLWFSGTMGNRNENSGIARVETKINGIIHSSIPAGNNPDMHLLITLFKGNISTEWSEEIQDYSLEKRLLLFPQTSSSNAFLNFKSARYLKDLDYELIGVSADKFLPAGSIIREGYHQWMLPLSGADHSGTWKGSSLLYGMSHINDRVTTLVQTASGGGSSAVIFDFGGDYNNRYAELPSASIPNQDGVRPWITNQIDNYQMIPNAVVTPSTVTPLLYALKDNLLLTNAPSIDFLDGKYNKKKYPTNISQESFTLMDVFAQMTYLAGPRQSNAHFLVTNSGAGALNLSRAGDINLNDSDNYPTQFGLTAACSVIFDYAQNRFFAIAAGKVVADGEFNEDSCLISWKPRSYNGDVISCISFNGTRTLYDTDGKPYDAGFHLGIHRKTSDTSSFAASANNKMYKGSAYGTETDKFKVSFSLSTAQDCTNTLYGGYGATSRANGVVYAITKGFNYVIPTEFNSQIISVDGTSTIDGSYTFGHILLGIDSGVATTTDFGYTWVMEISGGAASAPPPATLTPANTTPQGWHVYGNNVGTNVTYNVGTTYRSISGGPWVYDSNSCTADVRMHVYKIPEVGADAKAERITNIQIGMSAFNYALASITTDSSGNNYMTVMGPVTVNLAYSFIDTFANASDVNYVAGLMDSGGTTIDSFVCGTEGISASVNTDAIYSSIPWDGTSKYIAVWLRPTSFPDAPHVAPVVNPPPTGTNFAAGLGNIGVQMNTNISLICMKNGISTPTGKFITYYPDFTGSISQSTINQLYSHSDKWAIPAPAWMDLNEVFPNKLINNIPGLLLFPKPDARKLCFSTQNRLFNPISTSTGVTQIVPSKTIKDKLYLTTNTIGGSNEFIQQGFGLIVDPNTSVNIWHLGSETGITDVFNLSPYTGSVSAVGGEAVFTANSNCGYTAIIAYDDYNKIPGILPITVSTRRLGTFKTGAASDKYYYYESGTYLDTVNKNSILIERPFFTPSFLCGPVAVRLVSPNGGTTLNIYNGTTVTNGMELQYQSSQIITISGSSPSQWIGTANIKTYDNNFTGTLIEDVNYTVFNIGASKTLFDPNLSNGDTINFVSSDGLPWEPYLTRAINIEPQHVSSEFINTALFPLAYNTLFTTSDRITWTLNIPNGWNVGENGVKFIVVGKVPQERIYACSEIFIATPLVQTVGSPPSPSVASNGEGISLNFGDINYYV